MTAPRCATILEAEGKIVCM